MSILDFFKKKPQNCKCGSCDCKNKEESVEGVGTKITSTSSYFTVKVYGNCCKKSSSTFQNAQEAIKELGFNWNVEQIEDLVEIAKAGILQTPGLAINEKVLSQGKALSKDKIKKIFEDLAN